MYSSSSVISFAIAFFSVLRLEQEVILALIKAFRQDAMARGTEGMTSWDTTRMYTTETLAVMLVQKGIVDDLVVGLKGRGQW